MLKEPIRKCLERAGYDLVPLSRNETSRLQRLLLLHEIQTVIDVGANQGQYARRMRVLGFTGQLLSFEPGTAAFRRLERHCALDAKWSAIRMALGCSEGSIDLNVSRNSVSSSLLKVGERHLAAAPESRIRSIERVPIRRLDDVVGKVPGPVWLKIDAQGYELEVLRGADKTMRRSVILQLEVSLVPLYEGQASLLQVLEFLAEDYVVIDILEGFRSRASQELLQCDVLAVRKTTRHI